MIVIGKSLTDYSSAITSMKGQIIFGENKMKQTLSVLNRVDGEYGLLIRREKKVRRPIGKNFASPNKPIAV